MFTKNMTLTLLELAFVRHVGCECWVLVYVNEATVKRGEYAIVS